MPEKLPRLLSEAEALEAYGHLLEDRELRKARQSGVLGYYKRKNRIFYREDELLAFIANALEARYVPPLDAPAGATAPRVPKDFRSMPDGMTPELERAAATLLREQITRRPRKE